MAFTDPHITFGAFFRYNYSNSNYTYLISKGNDAFSISIDNTNTLMRYEVYADGHEICAESSSVILPNKDYEAIVTYDGSHAQLYINGIVNGKGVNYTASALGPRYNTYNWTIGSSNDATYGLNGTIYEFYMYNRTLTSSEILNLYVSDIHNIKNLKPGGIALSWDDSPHIDSCYQYLSLFHEYNATCTMNVNRLNSQTEVVELNALHLAGWEIASHGYDHIDTRKFLTNNTPTAFLNQEIFPSIKEIYSYNYPVHTFVYPFSSRDETTDALLTPYFRTLRTDVPQLINGNVIETTKAYYNWDNTTLLYGVEIDDQSGVSLQSIENGIDYAIKTGSVLILYGHEIVSNVNGPYQTSKSRLESILYYTNHDGGVYYHLRDLGNSSWVPPSNNSIMTANYTSNIEKINYH